MMNLWELLKVSKGLSPHDVKTLLFAKKFSDTERIFLVDRSVGGYPCILENSAGRPLVEYKIYGNTINEESVGNPVYVVLKDSEGSVLYDSDGYKLHSDDVWGYRILAVTKSEDRQPVRTSIFLEKPLKTGEILKYPENVLVRADGTSKNVILPEIPTFSGTTTIEIDTEIQPSNIEVTYKAKGRN